MKLLKIGLSLLAAASLIACGDDDSSPSFNFNEENIVGTYSMDGLETFETSNTLFSDSSTSSSETTGEGSIFTAVDLTFTETGTFTISGGYALNTIVESDDGDSESNVTISISDAGTYVIDEDDKTITFTSSSAEEDQFLNGIYDIEEFSASSLDISQTVDSGLVQGADSSTSTNLTKEYFFTIDR